MHQITNLVYDIALAVALCATALGLGFSSDIAGFVTPLRNWRLLAKVVALDVAVVPLLVWALNHLFAVPAGSATGLVLVGISSAGPLGIVLARMAGGNPRAALSFVLVLEAANVIVVPAWAVLLLPSGVAVPVGQVIATLVLLVLVPLAAGMGVRALRGRTVERWSKPLAALSSLLVLVIIAVVLARDGHYVVAAVGDEVATVAALTVLAALVVGWVVGGPEREYRIVVALVTGVRANGLALTIAQASFPSQPAVQAAVATFGLCSIVLPLATGLALAARSRKVQAMRKQSA